jgi:hypothetical protein
MNQGEFWISNSASTRDQFLEFAQRLMDEHPYVVWEWIFGKPRTGKQNKSIHVFRRLLAKELNAKGYTVQNFFKEGFEMPFSEQIVRDHIWVPVQEGVAGKDSSKDLTTIQVQEVYEHINKALSDKGVHVPWPEKSEGQNR